MLTISQARSESEIAAVQGLIHEYLSWWAEQEPAEMERAPTFAGVDLELKTLPGIFSPPTGRLLLAAQDGQPAGCVCLKSQDARTAELKRLYVRPEFRGQKIGLQLVARLIEEARKIGYERIVLDSHITMKMAHEIYRSAGFRQVSPPDGYPEDVRTVAVFMEYDLPPANHIRD
jgi:GNAT superfamily N-acetyltransferase